MSHFKCPMLTAPSGIQTVQLFLNSSSTTNELEQSILSLRAKASIFFNKTARLCAANEYGASLRPLTSI